MSSLLRIFILMATLLSVSPGLQGSTKVDSLEQRLVETSGKEKAEVYLQLMGLLKFSDQESAMAYGNQGLQLARQLQLRALEPRLLLNIGIVHAIQADYIQSIDYYEQSIELFREIDDAKGVAQARNNLGLTYARQGDYDRAMDAYKKSTVVFEELADTSTVLLIKGNMANLAFKRGNYPDALRIYEELLRFGQRINSPTLIARYLGNVGRVHFKRGDYPLSLDHYYRAANLMDSLGNKTNKANLLNNIGSLFADLGMYDRAREYFLQSFQAGTPRIRGMVSANLADLYGKQGNYPEALISIRESIRLYDSLGIKSQSGLYITLANLQIETGDYASADDNLKQALQIGLDLQQDDIAGSYLRNIARLLLAMKDTAAAKKNLLLADEFFTGRRDLKGLYFVTEQLAVLYEADQEYEPALEFRNRHTALSDSLFGLTQSNKLLQLEVDQVRQKYIKSQAPDSAIAAGRKTYKWLVLTLLVVLCFAVWYGLRYSRQNKLSEQKLRADLQSAKQENQQIKTKLKQTNLEMTFLSLDLAKKDDFLKKLRTELEKISRGHPATKKVLALIRTLHSREASNKDWVLFQQSYEQVFPNFFDQLQADYPALTVKQLRHCGLIRLKLSPEEVAEINAVSVNSVHKARHRLREKFGLTRKDKLEHFLTQY